MNGAVETDRNCVARHNIRPQSLQAARTHLIEVSMQNTDGEERRRVDELKELDVVAAVEGRVNVNCKLHLIRITHFCTQLLYLPTYINTDDVIDRLSVEGLLYNPMFVCCAFWPVKTPLIQTVWNDLPCKLRNSDISRPYLRP